MNKNKMQKIELKKIIHKLEYKSEIFNMQLKKKLKLE